MIKLLRVFLVLSSILLIFGVPLLWAQYGSSANFNLEWKVIESGGNEGDDAASASYRLSSCIGQPTALENEPSASTSYRMFAGFRKIDVDFRYPYSWFTVLLRYHTDTTFVIEWAGIDTTIEDGWGWGVWNYDIQYKVGAAGGWIDWLTDTGDTTGIFGPALAGSTYYFRLRAQDKARNEAPWGDEDTTTVDWKVEFSVTVAPGGLDLDGTNFIILTYYEQDPAIPVTDTLWVGHPAVVWCVPGTDAALQATSSASTGSERWQVDPGDDTSWTINDATPRSAEYYHQYLPEVVLDGTDASHTVSTEAHAQFGAPHTESGLFDSWSEWTDRSSTITFTDSTTGVPIRFAMDTASFDVFDAFIDTIHYMSPGIRVTVQTDFGEDSVWVDSVWYDTPYDANWFGLTTHEIGVHDTIWRGDSIRYVFSHWSDGEAIVHNVTIGLSDTNFIAHFTKEYRFILTNPGGHDTPNPIPGTYWFAEGSLVSGYINFSDDTFHCLGYYGTGSIGDGWDTTFSFNIDLPSSVEWRWVHGALDTLVVFSLYGTPDPAGMTFYTHRSEITATVDESVFVGGAWHRCTGWTAVGSPPAAGDSNSITFTIDEYSVIVWQWDGAIQWPFVVQSDLSDPTPSIGIHWYDDSTFVAGFVPDTVTGWHCIGYEGWGSLGDGFGNFFSFTITEPSGILWLWAPVDSIVSLEVTSIYGDPVPPVGTTYHTSGTAISAWVDNIVPGIPGTRYICTGWLGTGSVPTTGSTNSFNFVITMNSSIDWQWNTQYFIDLTYSGTPGTPAQFGEGWYEEGSLAIIRSEYVVFHSGTTWVFVAWHGGEATIGDSLSDSTDVIVDTSYTIEAEYDLGVLLTIVKDPYQDWGGIGIDGDTIWDIPEREMWTVMGSFHDIDVTSPDSTDTMRYVFNNWNTGAPTTFITVGPLNNDTTFIAYYNREFKVTIRKDPDADTLGWMDIDRGVMTFTGPASVEQSFWWQEGQYHDIEVSTPDQDACVRYEFDRWNTGETYNSISFGPVSSYTVLIAYYYTLYNITVLKAPRENYGEVYIEDSTYLNTDSVSFWAFQGSTYSIGVSRADFDTFGTDTLYTFEYWDDYSSFDTLRDIGPIDRCTTYVANYDFIEAILAVCLSTNIWDLDTIRGGDTRAMTELDVILVQNCGTIGFDLGMCYITTIDTLTGDTITLTPSYATGERDQFSLHARFDDNATPPAWYHPAYDLIKVSMGWADSDIYGPRGFNLQPPPDPSSTDNLWFEFISPTSSSFYEQPLRMEILLLAKIHLD
ncbi:hypothetical protein JW877_03865 [bacterium]|nr:hypothetical protein [bacterium]